MFCRKCGTAINEQTGICPQCGEKTGAVVKENKLQNLFKNKMILGAAGAAAVLLVIAVIIWMRPHKINLEEYVSISCSGYDGYGNARASLDQDALRQNLYEAKGISYDIEDYKSQEQIEEAAKKAVPLEECIASIELHISPGANIANGDELVVQISYNNELAKKQKIKFKGEEVKETAEGLKPIVEIDPFADLEVTFSGMAPYGYVDIQCNSNKEYIGKSSFNINPRDGLKNGDTVTVSIAADEEETVSHGFVVTQKEQKYEVSGLEEMVGAYEDLPDDVLNKIRTEAEEVVYSTAGQRYDNNTLMKNLAYAGYIMNTQKDNGGCIYNELYIIYKGEISNSQEEFGPITVYYPVSFYDIITSGGEFQYTGSEQVMGSSSIPDSWMYTDGYINPVTCYTDIMQYAVKNVDSECGDGFEIYAAYEAVSRLGDISPAYKDLLNEEAENAVRDCIANEYYNDFRAEEPERVGEILLTAKEADSPSEENKYIVVYSAVVSSDRKWFEPTKVYFPVEFDGVVKLGNGEYMTFEEPIIEGRSNFPESIYTTRGYVDGSQLFDKVVNANRADFTYDVSEEIAAFE